MKKIASFLQIIACCAVVAQAQQRSPYTPPQNTSPANQDTRNQISSSPRIGTSIDSFPIYTMLDLGGAQQLDTPSIDCSKSKLQGQLDGVNHPGGGHWFMFGLLESSLLPIVGHGLIVTQAYNSSSNAPYFIPQHVSINCYESGYLENSKTESAKSAFWGGSLMTGAIILTFSVIALTAN